MRCYPLALKKVRLHWSIHPEKDVAWYEKEKKRSTEDEIARELDISYTMSVASTVFKKEFKEHLHVFREPYEVNKNLPVIRVLDYGVCNATLFLQQTPHGNLIAFKEIILEKSSTQEQGMAIQAYSNKLECRGFDDYGDPAGGNAHFRGDKTDDEIVCSFGIKPCYGVSQSIADRAKKGRELIKRKLSERYNGHECIQIYGPGCPTLVEAFQFGYRYKTDRSGEIAYNDDVEKQHPYNDIMDCLRYACIELFDVVRRDEKPRKAVKAFSRNKYTGH